MRRDLFQPITGIVAFLCMPAAAIAHHAFSAVFDANKVVAIQGTVASISWSNPHVAVQILVGDVPGHLTLWTVRGDSPVTLARNGWQKNFLAVGQPVAVCGYEARKPTRGNREMSGEQVVFGNGVAMVFATTDVRTCLQVLPSTKHSGDSQGAAPTASLSVGSARNPIGPTSSPVFPMTNPIAPMGNPVGPAVSTEGPR
jgi:hypothetical protein